MNAVLAVCVLTLLALLCGLLIAWVAKQFAVEGNPIVEEINALLPQTQCGQCSYPGCRPYAEAIAGGEAAINQCPPGGEEGIKKLAELLDVEVLPLNAEYGEEQADQVVLIVEQDCIGCTKCIKVCPVDAIVGASRLMHTVISEVCTGCDLCIPACPVDCIVSVEASLPIELNHRRQPPLLQTIQEAQSGW